MTTDELLCGRQPEAGTVRFARNQWIEHRVLQVGWYSRTVVFYFYCCYDAVPDVAYRKVRYCTTSQRERAVAIECGNRIAHQVEEGLNHLVAIEINQRQARIIVPVNRQLFLVLSFDNAHDVLE